MRVFENQEFTSFYDRGGNLYEDLLFRKCKFISSSVSITEDVARRSTVRNVTLERCRVVGSALECAVVEDVLVDGLQTSDLHQAWGAVFKHVTLRGKIGRLMTIPRLGPRSRGTPEQAALEAANAAYYQEVNWALDISEAQSVELQLRGIPSHLIRRDTETQVVVTRQAALAGDWRDLQSVERTVYGLSIQRMLDGGADDVLLVADKRARDFKELLAGINDLRAAGIAH